MFKIDFGKCRLEVVEGNPLSYRILTDEGEEIALIIESGDRNAAPALIAAARERDEAIWSRESAINAHAHTVRIFRDLQNKQKEEAESLRSLLTQAEEALDRAQSFIDDGLNAHIHGHFSETPYFSKAANVIAHLEDVEEAIRNSRSIQKTPEAEG